MHYRALLVTAAVDHGIAWRAQVVGEWQEWNAVALEPSQGPQGYLPPGSRLKTKTADRHDRTAPDP